MNWRDYKRALAERDSVTLWVDQAVLEGWRETGGKVWRYSDSAILAVLSLRTAFKLTLGQTQGFLTNLKRYLELRIKVPHYSTHLHRAAGLEAPKLVRPAGGGPLHLAIDSSGHKAHSTGEGEWNIRMHANGKRPVSRKVHLGVDTAGGAIVAQAPP